MKTSHLPNCSQPQCFAQHSKPASDKKPGLPASNKATCCDPDIEMPETEASGSPDFDADVREMGSAWFRGLSTNDVADNANK